MKEQKKINTVRKIGYENKEAFYLIVRGVEVGVSAGLISVLYRFLLSFAEKGLMKILEEIKGDFIFSILWILLLCLLGFFVAYINRLVPMASGSGIPQLNGEIKGYLEQSWWRVILAKLVGGTTSVFAGLSLGREGPSVQLGGMAAKGVARLTGADKTTELRMISCGAGAGMSAAFNSPIAGVMFVLEEIHHSFDKNILCMGIVATITADYISKLFFGQSTIFNYDTVNFPLRHYWLLIVIGIILGICGVLYNIIMLKMQDWYKKIRRIPNTVKMPVVFAVSGIIGLFLPQVLCGGHSMVELLMNEHPGINTLLFLFAAKFFFGAFCFASGAPGGTLYPMCILGTYLGAILGGVAIQLFGLDSSLWEEFVVIGMAGFFSAIVRAPITGILLVFELTGNMNNLLPIATVALISYAAANLIGAHPFYEILLARIIADDPEPPKMTRKSEKVIQSYVIPVGSQLDKKKIKDIEWGRHSLIVTVERGEESITPNGNVELHAGDEIVFLLSQRHLANNIAHLDKLFFIE